MGAESVNLRRAIRSGVIATLVLTALMYLAPLVGFPDIDMAAAVGGLTRGPAATFSPAWWIGLAVFFAIGSVVSPLLFAVASPNLFGAAWHRGIEWGALVWTFGGVGAMVYMGMGFREPFASQPHMTTLASFLGHLVYGALLGVLMAPALRRLRREPA